MRLLRKLTGAFFFLFLLGVCQHSFGQGSLGELRGRVLDSAGAAVAGATVDVQNQATNETRTATTNEQGEFFVSRLVVGEYTITARSQGFADSAVKDVKISVSFVTEQNITLSPAGSQATVTVTAGDISTQVNTSDQQLSTLINNQKIQDLPLLSRNPSALVLLAPGTTQTDTALGGFSVNGSRERNNNFLVDGIDNNDTDVPGIPGGIATPNIDATEEFRVITGNFNAEYGRNTGAIVNTATKRGTNEFHGGAYIYYRSDKFAARNFFDTTGEAEPLDRKQYGFSLGGPIVKNKLFFFFNYEGDRQKTGTQIYRAVPTAEARTGILRTPAATGNAIDNRDNGTFGVLDVRPTGFNNITGSILFDPPIPNPAFSPLVQQLLSRIYPLPNYPVNGAVAAPLPGVFELYNFGFTARNDIDSVATRVDYQINSKNTLTGSFNFSKGDFNVAAPTFPQFDDEVRSPQTGAVYAFNLISTLKPNLVNELRVGTNRATADFNGVGDGGVSTALPDAVDAVLRGGGAGVSNFGNANTRALNIVTPFQDIAYFSTQNRLTGTTTIGDSLTWIKGNHTIKFGGEARFIYSNTQSNFSRQEAVDFGLATNFGVPLARYRDANNVVRNVPTTGVGQLINDYVSLLSGIVATQTQTQFFNQDRERVDNDFRRYRTREHGFFAQDTWRIRPDLTLNFGLRWEFNQVPFEKDGLMSNLVDQDASGTTPAGGFRFKTVGRNSENPDVQLWDSDWNNFGPRVGFAYSPSFENGFLGTLFGGAGKSSFRGGYGIFYDRVFTNLFSNASGNPPFSLALTEIPLNGTGAFVIDGLGRLTTRTTTDRVQDGDELGLAVIFPNSQNNILQDKFVTPNSASWNVGFQRDFGNNFLFEIDYVGTKGVNLIRSANAQLTSVARVNAITGSNNPISTSLRTNYLNGSLNTAFGQNSAFLIVSTGNSNYNAMQVRLTKTLTSKRFGLGQIQGFYTWSHSIDDAPDALVVGTSDRSLPRDSSGFAGGFQAERGDSSFDARHRFVTNFIYELPFTSTNAFLNQLIGNWTLSGIYQAQTGYPFTVFQNGVDRQGTGLSSRATFGSGSNNFTSNQTPENSRVYTGPDRSLFASTVPLDGQQGNVGRGVFRGPDFSTFDFSVIKRIPINERMRFTVRADFFNLFNRVNLNTPVSDVTSRNFGLSTVAGQPRIIQFAGRFDF